MGGKYTSNKMSEYCWEHIWGHCPIPHPNGVVERKSRTLMDMVNAMLLSCGTHENLWGEAFIYPLVIS